MYKIKILLSFFSLFVLTNNTSNSNAISVIYKIKVLKDNDRKDLDDKTKTTLSSINKALSELEYVLYCNSKSSHYSINDKLAVEDGLAFKLAKKIAGSGIFYKDDSIKIKHKMSFGEKFNVVYPYKDNWIITKDTKIINGYKCYKATTVREEKNYYKDTYQKFFPEVWFAPEIPYQFGPRGLDGLPGLVLEGTINGKTIFYASTIKFDCDDCLQKIIKPKAKKEILKDDYNKLMAEIRKEQE